MPTPPDYKPQAVSPAKRPPPAPPGVLKPQLYQSPEQFRAVDEQALQVAQTDYATFRDLLWELAGAHRYTPLQTTRAIFRWMTSKNMYTMKFSGGEPPNSPEAVLCGFKLRKATYARIFETLCSFSGIHCTIITGFAKGVEYRVGVPFSGTPANHSWNAVYLDGGWQMVDCHWATRYLNASERNVPENLVYEYDDFYFLPNPAHLVYTHFPEDPKWQLLSSAVGQGSFEGLPLTKSVFWKLGLSFSSHSEGIIQMNNGVVAITLSTAQALSFTYKLLYGDELQPEVNGVKLSRYVLQSTSDDSVTYYFRAPAAGHYAFTVYVQPVRAELSVENLFTAAVEYRLEADRAADNTEPYPLCSDTNWGPGAPVQQSGLTAHEEKGVVFAEGGVASVAFDMSRPLRFYCKLQKNGGNEAVLGKFLEQKVDGSRAEFIASLPEEAEYGLEVYANDPAKDGNTFTHICQYLLVNQPRPTSQEAYSSTVSVQIENPAPPQQLVGGVQQISTDVGRITLDYRTPSQNAPSPAPRGTPPATTPRPPATAPKPYRPPGGQQQEQDLDDLPPPPPPEMMEAATTQQTFAPPSFAPRSTTGSRGGQQQMDDLPPPPPDLYSSNTTVQGEVKPLGQKTSEQPPESFEAKPRAPPAPPKPQPLPPQQRELYNLNDPALFRTVDQHAQQVSRTDHPTFRDLMWDLINARNVAGDLEKARILFQWLCSKDLPSMTFSSVTRDSPEELLLALRDGKVTYAQVYELLCNYAGLHCVTLPGYAKGADYRPGETFGRERRGMHAWNAVCINGHYRLVDCHWAARRMVGQRDNVTYELDEYYFLPNPHQFIFSHLPEDPQYQLLERGLTQPEFESLPVVKSQFFKYGLYFASHHSAEIASCGEMVVRIGYPAHKAIGFSFTMSYENGKEETDNGVKLSRFGMYEQNNGVARFRVRPPEAGNFRLIIYAKENTAETKEGVYGAVCEYKVVQTAGAPQAPFPPCQSPCWGPGDAGERYGLVVSNSAAEVRTAYGQAEITFQLSGELRFLAKLKAQDMSEEVLEQHVLHRVVDRLAVFSVSAPARGEYGLEIYVNDPARDGNSFRHLCQYLVTCDDHQVSGQRFPVLQSGYLGPQLSFASQGMIAQSHADPYVTTSETQVEVALGVARPMRITTQLMHVETRQKFADYVLVQTRGNTISFVCRFPRPGMYQLNVFALPASDRSENLPGVFNYLINYTSTTAPPGPFPRQYGQWKEGCYLYSPLDGDLSVHKGSPSLKWMLDVPNSKQIAVVVGDEWTKLTQKTADAWEGEVDMSKAWGVENSVAVCANFGGDLSSFSTLLEYTM